LGVGLNDSFKNECTWYVALTIENPMFCTSSWNGVVLLYRVLKCHFITVVNILYTSDSLASHMPTM
jgi:hypothetical protein